MIPELVACFDRTVAFLHESVADLSDDDLVLQPPGVPNHAAWTLGHVIHSCQAMAGELGVEPWLPPDWESRFGYGSSPADLVTQHPSSTESLTALREASHRRALRCSPWMYRLWRSPCRRGRPRTVADEGTRAPSDRRRPHGLSCRATCRVAASDRSAGRWSVSLIDE